MEKFARGFFSMRMMAIALFVFLAAIGTATFLESIYDIQTAKIMVYNAKWFELLLIYLTMSMIANIFNHKMYQREKIAMLVFHISFIVMIIGAGVTRYFGFEGLMIIKEGATVNFMYSSEPEFMIKAHDGVKQHKWKTKAYMSEVTDNYFDYEFDFPGHKSIEVEYVNFRKKSY